MASTIPLTAKTLTKYMQLDFAEEMLTQMFAVIVSIMPRLFSRSFVPIKRRQLDANCVDQFNDDLSTLLESLRREAVAGGSLRKFAAGNATAPNFQTLYALVRYTPDLSEKDCSDCLRGAIEGIPQCCDGKQGGRVVNPSCNIKFEVYPVPIL
ncbi:cysteine-rich receptor-like protein kinase 25 [Corylus avellana]|uniref:cysteine-rich receptor-like protein kinase 25 n=1 Tax=Corylus avellana TaxID=13451 RepID=UPI00286B2BA8|nr:cysteine-rich receptor-like protein kinase 25 [Corylus avellana]